MTNNNLAESQRPLVNGSESEGGLNNDSINKEKTSERNNSQDQSDIFINSLIESKGTGTTEEGEEEEEKKSEVVEFSAKTRE